MKMHEKQIYLGTTADGARVYVEVEIEDKGDGKERLSISGSAHPGGCGQIVDTVEQITQFADGWGPERRDDLIRIWKRWHLNDMHAGCEHQRALGWGHGKDIALTLDTMTPQQTGALTLRNANTVLRQRQRMAEKIITELQDSRGACTRFLQAHGRPHPSTHDVDLLQSVARSNRRVLARTTGDHEIVRGFSAWIDADVAKSIPVPPLESEIFKDSVGAPCPECGYGYGTVWRYEPLPEEVKEFVLGLSANVGDPYEHEAQVFLDRFGLTFEAVRGDKPAPWQPAGQHYQITIANGSRRRLSFDFWTSLASGMEPPEAYSVLACIGSDIGLGSADEIVAELGEMKPSQARAAAMHAKRLRRFFTKEEREALQEIQ
jgi:hypothetical protein